MGKWGQAAIRDSANLKMGLVALGLGSGDRAGQGEPPPGPGACWGEPCPVAVGAALLQSPSGRPGCKLLASSSSYRPQAHLGCPFQGSPRPTRSSCLFPGTGLGARPLRTALNRDPHSPLLQPGPRRPHNCPRRETLRSAPPLGTNPALHLHRHAPMFLSPAPALLRVAPPRPQSPAPTRP